MIPKGIKKIIVLAVSKKASDIHICAGAPILLRIGRDLIPATEGVLTPELSERMTAINADLTASRLESAPPSVAAAGAMPLALAASEEPGALGQRIFSITEPAAGRTGFYIYIVPGLNLAAAVVGGACPLLSPRPASRCVCASSRASSMTGCSTRIGAGPGAVGSAFACSNHLRD